jgi:hypothetical protein
VVVSRGMVGMAEASSACASVNRCAAVVEVYPTRARRGRTSLRELPMVLSLTSNEWCAS